MLRRGALVRVNGSRLAKTLGAEMEAYQVPASPVEATRPTGLHNFRCVTPWAGLDLDDCPQTPCTMAIP
jgi:hypothetical protein